MCSFLLCARGEVGYHIADFLREKNVLRVVVLDTSDKEWSPRIIEKSGLARENVLYDSNMYDPLILDRIKCISPDWIILSWWAKIVKRKFFSLAQKGALNFHPSYLPFNAGAHNGFWNIIEQKPYGVTIHHVDDGIDSGDIAFQVPIETSWSDTGASLFDKATKALVSLFKEKFNLILQNRVPRIPQPQGRTFHYRRELEEASLLDLDKNYTGRELLNLLRARMFGPDPGVSFYDQEIQWKVTLKNIKKVNEND